jgi:hypothetical protein
MYEIWTKGEIPYAGMTNQKVWVSIMSGYRLPRPNGCSSESYALMLDCWHVCGLRPTFASLAAFHRSKESPGTLGFAYRDAARPSLAALSASLQADDLHYFNGEIAEKLRREDSDISVDDRSSRYSTSSYYYGSQSQNPYLDRVTAIPNQLPEYMTVADEVDIMTTFDIPEPDATEKGLGYISIEEK